MSQGNRILVVEDDAAVRSVVVRSLRRVGYVVTEAANAEAALLRPAGDPLRYDLALVDLHLPGASGAELVELLLARDPASPVLVLTGERSEALLAGPVGVVQKPFGLDELEAAVVRALWRVGDGTRSETRPRSTAPVALPEVWVRLADRRSGAGYGHGRRVAAIAGVLASALPWHIEPEAARILRAAARVHELGRLVDEAAAPSIVADHSARILSELAVDSSVVRTVLHMHERRDGSGGPHGLAGDEIPITARLLGVADAVDHRAAAAVAEGAATEAAMASAVNSVAREAAELVGPNAVAALRAAGSAVEAARSCDTCARDAERAMEPIP